MDALSVDVDTASDMHSKGVRIAEDGPSGSA
jgi:hypothetical protein